MWFETSWKSLRDFEVTEYIELFLKTVLQILFYRIFFCFDYFDKIFVFKTAYYTRRISITNQIYFVQYLPSAIL